MSRSLVVLLSVALLASCAAENERIVHVMAKTAPGVRIGTRVQYKGAEIGLVQAVYQTPSGVRMDVLMSRPETPLQRQDAVRIVTVGSFGEQVVQIEPAAANSASPDSTAGTIPTPTSPSTP